jgi:hypothetical protein
VITFFHHMQSIRNELRYGRQFLSFSFLKILGQILLFVVPLLIARFLAPDAFGAYALSIMIVYFSSSARPPRHLSFVRRKSSAPRAE